jgi:hypothetical protein
MKKISKQFLAILFLATIFTSCALEMLYKVNGNQNVLVRERTSQAPFSGIHVSTGVDVYIRQGTDNAISIEADENLHDLIITEIDHNILKIYSEKNIWKAKAKKIYVTVKDLKLLKATSGCNVSSETVIKTGEMTITATSGADVYFEVETKNLTTNATSGSDLKISGTTVGHVSSATSGSTIDAYTLKSENVIVETTSGADISIFASKKIEAKATSGSSINFKGTPTIVNTSTTSGGSISKK